MVLALSAWLGNLSTESSTMLWSPSIMSDLGRFSSCHIWRTSFQNFSFLAGWFGAYIASTFSLCSLCHCTVIRMALPLMIVFTSMSWVQVISLFRTMAPPWHLAYQGLLCVLFS